MSIGMIENVLFSLGYEADDTEFGEFYGIKGTGESNKEMARKMKLASALRL
jgi:hypothetical protein